jgi:hypothetical protein
MENAKLFGKMFLYIFVTTIITFVSLVDTLDAHYFNQISDLDWIKIGLKSLAPGLISLKAFLDTSMNESVAKPQQNSTEQK